LCHQHFTTERESPVQTQSILASSFFACNSSLDNLVSISLVVLTKKHLQSTNRACHAPTQGNGVRLGARTRKMSGYSQNAGRPRAPFLEETQDRFDCDVIHQYGIHSVRPSRLFISGGFQHQELVIPCTLLSIRRLRADSVEWT
jgi:hypothetical protein